ncbi:gephyrin-like molybdotransferase Glp [Pseudoruegeria sp. SHC-113]|uniref:molybdopterin molybdotransferase MoeA n=1 Tax=Pseudoruegeria sp. SHC-113 TaxID=2855439 RepID=UPI0021BAF99A|nr:gephyrin-like molybdotransferase Glp [Pseudoruegeria sp. SHC-113]MCT8160797.1 molybdopterin molybdotransferase MoeA [Pseudoruegeria sp. SHC-113]
MITVEEALAHVLSLVAPLEAEPTPLIEAAGRVLAAPVVAQRNQPPFPSSAMDGYAVAAAEVAPGDRFTVIGESAAGHGFAGQLAEGQAVRIFTGAPVPEGGQRIVIQEDVRREGDQITVGETPDTAAYIRPAGGDFAVGHALPAPRVLSPTDLSLIAAMNCPVVQATRRPVVALIATGDELVMPGEAPLPDQIIASNSFALKALFEAHGAEVRLLPIARDTRESLTTVFGLTEGADLIVTTGGASVGDHDLVGDVAQSLGMERAFYKVAMRPGKPLMAGRMGAAAMVGLPGNPVSSIVCARIFVVPMLRKMLGLPFGPVPRRTATLAVDIGTNGPREHYMRARIEDGRITPFDRQDSSLLTILSSANCLMVRAPGEGPLKAGSPVDYIAFGASD